MRRSVCIVVVALITAAFLIVDFLLLPDSNVDLSPENWGELAKVAAVIVVAWAAGALVKFRLSSDSTSIARLIKQVAVFSDRLIFSLVLFVPLSCATSLFMYLAAATSAPLMDANLATIDAMLGIDWLAFHQWINREWIASPLTFAYKVLGPQVPFVLLLCAARPTDARLNEFLAMLAISAVPTAIGMYFIPAAGAYAYNGIPSGNFSTNAGMWHYDVFVTLRSGEPFTFLVTGAQGLTTFPSFHTTLGILVTYSLRGQRPFILWPIAIVNAAMIVSTIPEGGHHFIDVVAGIGVAVLTILAVAWLSRLERSREPQSGQAAGFSAPV